MTSDPAAFIRAVMGPTRPVDQAALAEFTRTPALREQLDRVGEACVLQREIEATSAEIEDAKLRIRGVLQREVAELNRLHLAQVAKERGIAFDG